MDDFRDKVAVVTGAASGIGLALAEQCAREGMRVVLADVEEQALQRTARELCRRGARTLAVRTDVSRASDVEALAGRTVETFGAVDLLFNNAGVDVGGAARVWENSPADWEWILGVNLLGVSHGIRTFLPLMLRQNTEGHVVNTASVAGLTAGPGRGAYRVTKQAVVSLSETLYHELAAIGSRIGVSVLCPAWVNTQFVDAERNRPSHLKSAGTARRGPEEIAAEIFLRTAVERGMSPEEVAVICFEAIRQGRFYILTHEDSKPLIRSRFEDLLLERNPTPPDAHFFSLGD